MLYEVYCCEMEFKSVLENKVMKIEAFEVEIVALRITRELLGVYVVILKVKYDEVKN